MAVEGSAAREGEAVARIGELGLQGKLWLQTWTREGGGGQMVVRQARFNKARWGEGGCAVDGGEVDKVQQSRAGLRRTSRCGGERGAKLAMANSSRSRSRSTQTSFVSLSSPSLCAARFLSLHHSL